MQSLFTIGHSNHSPESFLALLQQHNITAIADVRSHPYSKYLPHFNQKTLENLLKKYNIAYVFLGKELGARPDIPECYVEGKAIYEKIASTDNFKTGLNRVAQGTKKYKIALMCAEKDPLTCHRAVLVCQHLKVFNLDIKHIHFDGNLENHKLLEIRMLRINKLENKELEGQLSLFSNDTIPKLTQEERIKKAYHQQGLKIAYVEH